MLFHCFSKNEAQIKFGVGGSFEPILAQKLDTSCPSLTGGNKARNVLKCLKLIIIVSKLTEFGDNHKIVPEIFSKNTQGAILPPPPVHIELSYTILMSYKLFKEIPQEHSYDILKIRLISHQHL